MNAFNTLQAFFFSFFLLNVEAPFKLFDGRELIDILVPVLFSSILLNVGGDPVSVLFRKRQARHKYFFFISR